MSSAVPPSWQETYLDTLADTGQKAQAAHRAGIGLRVVVHRRHEDPAFARLEQEAIEASFDFIESEAIRRAVEGIHETRQTRTGETITRTIYSDKLLLALLQRHVWSKPHSAGTTPTPPQAQSPSNGQNVQSLSNGSRGANPPHPAGTTSTPPPALSSSNGAQTPSPSNRQNVQSPSTESRDATVIPFIPTPRYPTLAAYRAAVEIAKATVAANHKRFFSYSPPDNSTPNSSQPPKGPSTQPDHPA